MAAGFNAEGGSAATSGLAPAHLNLNFTAGSDLCVVFVVRATVSSCGLRAIST